MFWFWFVLHLLMTAADAACWVAAMRLTKRGLWRVLITIFLAAQLAGMLLGLSGFDWPLYVPKAVFVFFVTWHYLALAFVLTLLSGLAIARPVKWLIQGVRRATGVEPTGAAASVGPDSVSRREFFGTCAVLAPPLFNVGVTGFALAQLNEFRVRRLTLPLPALPRVLDGLTIAHISDVHVGRLTSGRVLS